MLEENVDVNLHDFGVGNGFWGMTPKAKATNRKNVDILDIIKIKTLCVKGHPQETEETTYSLG